MRWHGTPEHGIAENLPHTLFVSDYVPTFVVVIDKAVPVDRTLRRQGVDTPPTATMFF